MPKPKLSLTRRCASLVDGCLQRLTRWLETRRPFDSLVDWQALPTKDLFDRFAKLRESTRWSAVYLFTAAALLLAWSRSPSWELKVPFDLFVQGKRPLTLPSATALVFGPIIILFFFIRLYTVNRETLALGTVLRGRLRDSTVEQTLLELPFDLQNGSLIDCVLFFMIVIIGTLSLTGLLLGDFLRMTTDNGERLWHSLYEVREFWGVVPTHFGHSAGVTVFGFAQSWAYLALTVLDVWMLGMVFIDTLSYPMRPGAQPRDEPRV